MDLPVSLIVNIVMIGLLVLTIFYSILLNSRLKKIRDAKNELHLITSRFMEAMNKADSSIETLKQTATQVEGTLYKQILRAEELQSDLSFFIKRGDEISVKMEELILHGKPPFSVGAQNNGSVKKTDPKMTSEALILKALHEMR